MRIWRSAGTRRHRGRAARRLTRANPLRERLRERADAGAVPHPDARPRRWRSMPGRAANARRTSSASSPARRCRSSSSAILAQDPALEPPPRSGGALRGRGRRRAIAAACGRAGRPRRGCGRGRGARIRARVECQTVHCRCSALALDARSGEIERRPDVGTTPTSAAAGAGALWVLDADARTVLRVDPEQGTVETFATGATPTDLAVGGEAVWVGNGRRVASDALVGPVTLSVARFDAATRTERAEIPLPRSGGSTSNLVSNHFAVGPSALWAVGPDFSLARIDLASSEITAVLRPFPSGRSPLVWRESGRSGSTARSRSSTTRRARCSSGRECPPPRSPPSPWVTRRSGSPRRPTASSGAWPPTRRPRWARWRSARAPTTS